LFPPTQVPAGRSMRSLQPAALGSRVSGPCLVLRRCHEHDTSSAGGFAFAMSALTRVSAIDPRKEEMSASVRVAAHFSFVSLHRARHVRFSPDTQRCGEIQGGRRHHWPSAAKQWPREGEWWPRRCQARPRGQDLS